MTSAPGDMILTLISGAGAAIASQQERSGELSGVVSGASAGAGIGIGSQWLSTGTAGAQSAGKPIISAQNETGAGPVNGSSAINANAICRKSILGIIAPFIPINAIIWALKTRHLRDGCPGSSRRMPH